MAAPKDLICTTGKKYKVLAVLEGFQLNIHLGDFLIDNKWI